MELSVKKINIYDENKNYSTQYKTVMELSKKNKFYYHSVCNIKNWSCADVQECFHINLDDKIIGFGIAHPRPDDNEYFINLFCIDEEYRNKGYGTIALRKIEINGRIHKKEFVIVDIENNQSQVKIINHSLWYKRRGYEYLGQQETESGLLLTYIWGKKL